MVGKYFPCKDCLILPICRSAYLTAYNREDDSEIKKPTKGLSQILCRCVIIHNYINIPAPFFLRRYNEITNFMLRGIISDEKYDNQ
jgi:hypothetical protein